jgi:RHS repeat-associated protein
MRKYTIPQNMSVEYLVSTSSTHRLGDHLGSSSITTDFTGAKISEMRYKAWGEVRYSWPAGLSTTPAYELGDYTFTGQYSDSYINLLWYGSRHYYPALGRFSSADTIVPGGVQGMDRYAYANNSPIVFIDSTGHFTEDAINDYLLITVMA